MSNNPPIVVVAYNRPKSLKRLLRSLNNGFYPKTDVTLIISIDRSEKNQDVLDIAENFVWSFGKKEVKYQKENLGLRKHIIKCGGLTDTYGSVIMLEDDLFVSPNFYNYAISALAFSNDKDYIGGISLYNHKTNVHTGEYFGALEDGFDNYYFQFASSWGQAWNKEQWDSFMAWYGTGPRIDGSELVPKYVSSWSEKSWLKYFIAYLIFHDKFFLYPKISLSTNFNDPGTHVQDDSTIFQTELLHCKKETYYFSRMEDSRSVYDAFYESICAKDHIDVEDKSDIEVDLYGCKESKKRYLISSKQLDHKILKGYSRSLKPIEMNVVHNIEGDDFWLYDTTLSENNQFRNNRKRAFRRAEYSTKYVSHKWANLMAVHIFWNRLKSKYNQLIKK